MSLSQTLNLIPYFVTFLRIFSWHMYWHNLCELCVIMIIYVNFINVAVGKICDIQLDA